MDPHCGVMSRASAKSALTPVARYVMSLTVKTTRYINTARRNVFASAVRALVSGLVVATARLLVLVNAHMRMWSRQRLSVDTLRPHLQAEHGLDVLASLVHPVTGTLFELHRVRVPALDLVTHDPPQRVAQWLRRARLKRPLRGRDHWAHIESGGLKACEGSSFTRPVHTHDRLEEPPVRNLARLRPEISRLPRKIEGLPHLLFALHGHVREHQVYVAALERSARGGDDRTIQRVTVRWHPSSSWCSLHPKASST